MWSEAECISTESRARPESINLKRSKFSMGTRRESNCAESKQTNNVPIRNAHFCSSIRFGQKKNTKKKCSCPYKRNSAVHHWQQTTSQCNQHQSSSLSPLPGLSPSSMLPTAPAAATAQTLPKPTRLQRSAPCETSVPKADTIRPPNRISAPPGVSAPTRVSASLSDARAATTAWLDHPRGQSALQTSTAQPTPAPRYEYVYASRVPLLYITYSSS